MAFRTTIIGWFGSWLVPTKAHHPGVMGKSAKPFPHAKARDSHIVVYATRCEESLPSGLG